jgi:hypothetical protein
MYIQKGNKTEILPPLGFGFLDISADGTEIIQLLKVDFKKDCKYYSNLQLNALNSGLISQTIYNGIKENESEKTAIIQVGTATIEKSELTAIIPENLQINLDLKTKEIIQGVINAGYQIITKF